MTPTEILLHHSATKDGRTFSWGAIRRYHMSWAYKGYIIDSEEGHRLLAEGKTGVKKPWNAIGYHFGVERVNDHIEILFGRMPNRDGAHCWQDGMNKKSVGICVVGNFDEVKVPRSQWYATLRLVKWLMEAYNIPKEKVDGHRIYAPKSCPGEKFDLDEFRGMLP